MYTCYFLLKNFSRPILLVFISIFMVVCEGKNSFLSIIDRNYCPFIETLSFGSDFRIQCNNSYLIFNQINNGALKWKFANQTSICDRDTTQEGSINQCGISRLDSNYLKVPLKSLENYEGACIYCRINSKPISPSITVTQSDEGLNTLYTFNITANNLAPNESFEILWAKRVNAMFRHSYNYWFLQECVDPIVKILIKTAHTIIFAVDDVTIDRVEFIIRRCNGTCRKYEKCPEDYVKEADPNYFETPDSIEKISCDSNCLNGIISLPIPVTTTVLLTSPTTISTTTKATLNFEERLKFILLVISIGLLIIIISIMLIVCIHFKVKGKKHIYTKTGNVDPDEHK